MRLFPLLLVLFFTIPLIEIYLLIQVGSVIGAGWTVFLVVLTAVLGAALLRQQGLSTLARFQQSVARGELPATTLIEGMVLLVGGAMLLTPGFFTDALGFLCLFPPTRLFLARWLVSRAVVQVGGVGQPPRGSRRGGADDGRTIEGEFHEVDDKPGDDPRLR
jgi:UPF0716 protein FxsA